MGCVQSYFKRAHNAGMSPSSTQESTSKQAASDDGQVAVGTQEERSITEEPESNDTSHGVEATAVRTLAATTGTVAILGTTAKTADKKESDVVETIPEEKEEAVAVIHEEEVKDSSCPDTNEKNSGDSVALEKPLSPVSIQVEKKEETPTKESPLESNKSPPSDSNKTIVNSPEEKSPEIPPEEAAPKISEENVSDIIVLELAKDKEEDVSKSISSERLKTNSISNTTLSSDSIAEIENNSVKQSPSTDKVIESFDSSSTVEFVDTATKDVTKVEDARTNPARSISSDLSNKVSLPVDGEKTPDVLSPAQTLDTITAEQLPPPPSDLEQVVKTTGDVTESPVKITNDDELISKDLGTLSPKIDDNQAIENSSLKDNALNETHTLNSEGDSDLSNNVNPIVKTDSAQEVNSPSAIDSSSPIISDNNKAETRSPFSSNNSSSFKENGDSGSPETEVAKGVASPEEQSEKEKVTSPVVNMTKTSPDLVNGISSGSVTPTQKSPNAELISNSDIPESKSSLGSLSNEMLDANVSGKISDEVFGSSTDITDEKVVAAATTIQASFRGFQTRQNLKSNEPVGVDDNNSEVHNKVILDEVIKPTEKNEALEDRIISKEEIKNTVDEIPINSKSEEVKSSPQTLEVSFENNDEKISAAATVIQANFRGFQTRQMMKTKLDSGLPPSEETDPFNERKTPTALTPELIESVKEEVDEICKEAETIVAERSESVEGMLKGVDQVVVESKTALPSVSESVLAVRGSTSPPSVSDAGAEESLDTEDSKGEVFDPIVDVDADDKAIQAATAIQATFRGFQTRKNLQKDTVEQLDSMPNYPPPAAEDEYLQSLEDLPPPDFEALESSYSEDVPTEPLAPPPPLQDSLVFNEEDEDELMSLQSIKTEEVEDVGPALRQDTDSSDSSLSSAATKIQAGVRGYLTRRQIQVAGGGTGTGTGTTSTSTNLLDSDLSQSISRDEDGVRSALSLEQESEICRHRASPERDLASEIEATPRPLKSAGKRMSLGSNVVEPPPARRAPLRSALSVQAPGGMASDEEVWSTLKGEMADAATKIQSNFRGYRARKQLQREDAVQVTSSSSQATPSSGSGRESAASAAAPQAQASRGSGEYHDMIALSPPVAAASTGGGGPAAQPEVGESTRQESAEMVKRRAELEGDQESTAATKIQATFRGFKARQGMRDVDRAAAKIQAGFRGYKVRKEMKRGRGSSSAEQVDRKTPQPGAVSEEETAATKIQAGVRGFLVRRRNQKEQAGSGDASQPQKTRVDQ